MSAELNSQDRPKKGDISEKNGSKKRKRKDKEKEHEQKKKKRRHKSEDHQVEVTDTPQTPPSPTSDHSQKSDFNAAPASNVEINPKDSPFFVQSTLFFLPLSPIAQSAPLDGLCAEHFSPLILTFAAPFNGIVLSYSNARFLDPQSFEPSAPSKPKEINGNHKPDPTDASPVLDMVNTDSTDVEKPDHDPLPVMSKAIDEYGVTYVWVAADFLILRPPQDSWIEGHVNVQSPSQLGLVCWNLVNASIERKNLPKQWRWVDGDDERQQEHATKGRKKAQIKSHSVDGYYVDEHGNKIQGTIRFRVLEIESLQAFGRDRNFMSIEGSMLPKDGKADTSK